MPECKLVNCAAVLVAPDIRKTADWYREKLGFRVVEHFHSPEPFAAMYRNSVEFILVQAKLGTVEPNRVRYGAGYDAYLSPESPAAMERFHMELTAKGVRIVQPPVLTAYGSRELVFEDIDSRWIGVGCIEDEAVFLGKAE
jgi:catechol 2,3-dioxygenase-like lactoylglutathione lyase family enzyme